MLLTYELFASAGSAFCGMIDRSCIDGWTIAPFRSGARGHVLSLVSADIDVDDLDTHVHQVRRS